MYTSRILLKTSRDSTQGESLDSNSDSQELSVVETSSVLVATVSHHPLEQLSLLLVHPGPPLDIPRVC